MSLPTSLSLELNTSSLGVKAMVLSSTAGNLVKKSSGKIWPEISTDWPLLKKRGAYNRTFPCMEATYPYAIKNQERRGQNTPLGVFCVLSP